MLAKKTFCLGAIALAVLSVPTFAQYGTNRAAPRVAPPADYYHPGRGIREASRKPSIDQAVRASSQRISEFFGRIGRPRPSAMPPQQYPQPFPNQAQPAQSAYQRPVSPYGQQPQYRQLPPQSSGPIQVDPNRYPRYNSQAPSDQPVRARPISRPAPTTSRNQPAPAQQRSVVRESPPRPQAPRTVERKATPPEVLPKPLPKNPVVRQAPPEPRRELVKPEPKSSGAPQSERMSIPDPKPVVRETPPAPEQKQLVIVPEPKRDPVEKPTTANSSDGVGDYPTARRASTRGHVISPFLPEQELDVTGIGSGELAVDPRNGEIFLVP